MGVCRLALVRLSGGGCDGGDKAAANPCDRSVNAVDVTEQQTKVDDERDQRKP